MESDLCSVFICPFCFGPSGEKIAWENHIILFSLLAFPIPLLLIFSSGSSLILSGPWLRFGLLCCHRIKDDRNKPCKYSVLINYTEHFSFMWWVSILGFSHEPWGIEGFPFKMCRFSALNLCKSVFLWVCVCFQKMHLISVFKDNWDESV